MSGPAGYGDSRHGLTPAPAYTTDGRFEVMATVAAPPPAYNVTGSERGEWPLPGLKPKDATTLLTAAGITLLLFLLSREGAGRRRRGRARGSHAPGRRR